MNRLHCASLSPIDLQHAWLAVETARAGGVGLLDAAHLAGDRLARADANTRQLVESAPDPDRPAVGIRLRASQLDGLAPVLARLEGRAHWVLVSGWTPETLAGLLGSLAAARRAVWLEVGAAGDTARVDPSLPFAGWAACGAECGGLAGTESAFILAQHLARQSRPFLVRGGIGLHTAAACRVAGAAGVVLDDALLLLRESPLPPRWRHLVGRLGLTDTAAVGRSLGLPVRTLDRPEAPAARALGERATAIERTAPAGARASAWMAAVESLVGWDEPERRAWPIGEGAGRARAIAARHRTVGRLVRAVVEAADRQVADAARLAPLAAGAPLAASHGTTYPIVQGPMTRVSDRVEFAAAVGASGALPLFALALMRAPEIEALLSPAADALAPRPWGVGILGFVPDDLRQEQLAVVERARPPFALVSGGLPAQAAALEAKGIATYLHAPAPLLRPFVDEGARRFVFEGGECGGHVGPWHSFSLWDFAVDTLATLPQADAEATHVLFAGGIHDGLSAAMVAALASPLAALGVRVGVLMGTAYLFTAEAVETGAITPAFQRQAVSSAATATIETGPGHVIRCAPTPFVESFERERVALARQGVSGAALGDALEALVVGRSRVASKGLERQGDRIVAVDAARQLADGLYMLGDLATLRAATTTMAALHDEVATGGTARLGALAARLDASRPAPAGPRPQPADVAIVGASCLMPGARDLDAFWRNLLARTNAITEIPRERWDWRMYYDADPAARDRVYSRWGGFVDPIPFDPVRFGVPPRSMPSITLPQLMALELTRRALVDAGYGDQIADPAVRARTAVIFGAGNTADLESLYITRSILPLVSPQPGEDVLARLPEWTAESYPGLLASVVAGRVANRFDLGGPNLTVDAACASSLAALDLAVRELADGRSDLAITGGVEFELSPHVYLGFSRTRALSPRGRADVFDRGADGIVISEGGVVLVLKRLADAEADGDRVYAVIKSVAGSSDGRGLSLTAPRPGGQRRALERAYEAAGIDPATIGLYEAHGTGTALGDAAELETIGGVLRDHGAGAGDCVAGSIKSLIGHTRTAAGAVALLKTALALHHRVLPPHAGVTDPLPALAEDGAPLRIAAEPLPWLSDPRGPRRAGVSAFGFGGTNFHVVVEEHRPASGAAPDGAAAWPAELFVFAAADREALAAALTRAARAAARLDAFPADGSAPPPFRLADLAHALAVEARRHGPARAAIVAASARELADRAGDAAARLAAGDAPPDGTFVGEGEPAGALAFLFPGQGSQYPGMARELALFVPEMRRAFEAADARLEGLGDRLSRLVMPRAAFGEDEETRQRRRLADTRVAQPAIGVVSCGLLDLARRLGLTPAAVAGHSYGELVALHAAGAIDRDALIALSEARGRAMADVGPDAGTMAVVALPEAEVSRYLAPEAGVVIANLNAPDQTVISGTTAGIADAAGRLRAGGHTVVPIPVAAAFHSPLMTPARATLEEAVRATTFAAPSVPVHANLDGRPYPADAAAIGARLVAHLEERVDFVAQIERMYDAGIRTFVELGPGRVLTSLTRRILSGRPHLAVTADGGMAGLAGALARVFAAGHDVDVPALFDGRAVTWVDLDRLPAAPVPADGWLIDGGRVWPAGAPARTPGREPLLDRPASEEAARARVSSDLPAPVALPPAGTGGDLVDAYREYEETMRRFLDQQERMLAEVVARASGTAGAPLLPERPTLPATDATPPAPSPAPATGAGGLDREGLVARLVEIAGDRTGYATPTLGLDLDLEADLGIDSIKRVEILGAFVQGLPPEPADRLKAQLDRLTRLRTLGEIVDRSLAAIDGAPRETAGPGPAAAADCPRFVMRAQPAPLHDAGEGRLEGLHLVTEDRLGVAALVAEALAARGAAAHRVTAAELADDDALAARLGALRRAHGPVRGIAHLTPLGRASEADNLDDWRRTVGITTKRLFALLQQSAPDFGDTCTPRVLAVTAMGGAWGRNGASPGAEAAAGCHGLLRSFESDYPNARTTVVDVDAARPADQLAALVVREYVTTDTAREIGYEGDRRVLFAAEPLLHNGAAETAGWKPERGWVVLVTGGTGGIIGEVCRDLAAPGVVLVLVGRGPAGDDMSPERRARLDVLRAAGAEVEYHSVDVRRPEAFGALIDGLYDRFGRIDAVVHGAGAIEDRRFDAKTAEAFDRIFDTKADSAIVLARHLRPESLRWIVLFGSVSGRFGNRGQADYAAANETLNRVAWSLRRRWPRTRVVAINWGPWRGAGMADATTLMLLAARGFEPLDPEAGRRFFVDELRFGRPDDVEVVAGAGPWAGFARRQPPAETGP